MELIGLLRAKKALTIEDLRSLGGKARAKSLTAEERSESARRAAEARWKKARKKPK